MTTWDELPKHIQEDLAEWYNLTELDREDKARLAALYGNERFHAWNCPTCGERVRSGEPEDWGHFQGVCQPDFSSYPGDHDTYTVEMISRQCDECRAMGTSLSGLLENTESPEY